jgi:nicotinate-nucleotide adenylyltransferase
MGGTFDPPHRRHLGMLIEACHAISASSAIIVPAAANPLKDAQAAPPAVRWEMLQAALRDPGMPRSSAAIMVSGCELERGGTSYTIDTLRTLLPLIPGSTEHGPGAVRLLIGSDALMQLDRWRDWRAILELARPAVVIRPPHTLDEVRSWLAGFSERYALGDTTSWLLPLPTVELSSTSLRAALGRGERPDGILPEVAGIAERHRLYRA